MNGNADSNKKNTITGKKKLGAAAMAAVLAVNLLGGTQANIEVPVSDINPVPEYVIEETVDEVPCVQDIVMTDDNEKKRKKARIPIAGFVVFMAGWILSMLTGLFATALTPLGAKLLGWFFFTLGLFLAMLIILKGLCPDKSIKQLLNRKFLIAFIIILAVLIGISEYAAYAAGKYVLAIKIIILILGAAALLFAVLKIRKNEG